MVFSNSPYWPILRQVRTDRSPGPARIGSLQQIWFEIVVLVVVKTYVRGIGSMIRSDDAADVGHLADAGKLLDAPPVLAAVLGDIYQTVISANVKQAVFLLRFCNRGRVT